MKIIYCLMVSILVLVGFISIFLGKYLSVEKLTRKRTSFKVIDEKNYVKYCRILSYVLGLFSILFGIEVFLINGRPILVIASCFIGIIIILLITASFSIKLRKYIGPVSEFNKRG